MFTYIHTRMERECQRETDVSSNEDGISQKFNYLEKSYIMVPGFKGTSQCESFGYHRSNQENNSKCMGHHIWWMGEKHSGELWRKSWQDT